MSLFVAIISSAIAVATAAWFRGVIQPRRQMPRADPAPESERRALPAYQAKTAQVGSSARGLPDQNLFLLWDRLTNLNELEPDATSVNTRDLHRAVNTLQLIALSCESGLVDEHLAIRFFGDSFVRLYESVDRLPAVPDLAKTGATILKENPSVMAFYAKLKQ